MIIQSTETSARGVQKIRTVHEGQHRGVKIVFSFGTALVIIFPISCFPSSYASFACVLYLITSRYKHSFLCPQVFIYFTSFLYTFSLWFLYSNVTTSLPTAHIRCTSTRLLACILIPTCTLNSIILIPRKVSIIR